MRSVTGQAILDGVAARMGVDVAMGIPSNMRTAWLEYINQRLREGWEVYPWPELVRVEARRAAVEWGTFVTYVERTEVFFEGTYYRCLVENATTVPVGKFVSGAGFSLANGFYAPLPSGTTSFIRGSSGGSLDFYDGAWVISTENGPAYRAVGDVASPEMATGWEVYPGGIDAVEPVPTVTVEKNTGYWLAIARPAVIPAVLAGYAEMGEVLGVYSGDPHSGRQVREYDFELVDGGVIAPLAPAVPWVKFTLRPPVITVANLGESLVPYVIADFVKIAATAEAEREDGQFDKAAALDARAVQVLDQELDKIQLKQGQQCRWAAGMR